MHKPRHLILVAVVLLLVGTLSAVAADAPSGSAAPVPLDADAMLRKVEINVGLKNYEKVLAAKFEAEFELQLGPPDSTLPPEQKVAWTETQSRKCDVLTKMAAQLREQIKEWIALENNVAQAKGEVKAVPPPVIINRAERDLRDSNGPLELRSDYDANVPHNFHDTKEIHGTHATVDDKTAVAESLKVVVKPAVTTVHPQEEFKVALRVENTTKESQTIKVMNCSWDQHWKIDNPKVTYIGWKCPKNFPEELVIPAGEAYTKELEMLVRDDAPPGRLTFRMGFTPIGSPTTFWSEPIELEVKAQ